MTDIKKHFKDINEYFEKWFLNWFFNQSASEFQYLWDVVEAIEEWLLDWLDLRNLEQKKKNKIFSEIYWWLEELGSKKNYVICRWRREGEEEKAKKLLKEIFFKYYNLLKNETSNS